MSEIKPDYKDKNYNFYHTNGEGLHNYPDELPLAEIEVYLHDSCMVCKHNFPCPVCKTRPAIADAIGMFMMPCDACQGEGYQLIKRDLRPWYIRMWF